MSEKKTKKAKREANKALIEYIDKANKAILITLTPGLSLNVVRGTSNQYEIIGVLQRCIDLYNNQIIIDNLKPKPIVEETEVKTVKGE